MGAVPVLQQKAALAAKCVGDVAAILVQSSAARVLVVDATARPLIVAEFSGEREIRRYALELDLPLETPAEATEFAVRSVLGDVEEDHDLLLFVCKSDPGAASPEPSPDPLEVRMKDLLRTMVDSIKAN